MSESPDIIIVGAGGSGLAAAVAARQSGAEVLLLEKQPQAGGTTALAVGSFTANQTPWQSKAGIQDDPESHAIDAGKFAPPDIEARNHTSLRAWFLRQTSESLQWLSDLGLQFEGPFPEPPNRQPRMHSVHPSGEAYTNRLLEVFKKLGGHAQFGVAVTGLRQSQNRVAGVTTEHEGETAFLPAKRGVILACGDYTNAPDLIQRFKGPGYENVVGVNVHSKGEGHLMGEQAGAALLNMDITYGPELRFPSKPLPAPQAWLHPENALFTDGAILINKDGHRFCVETNADERDLAVSRQPGGMAFLLLDEALIERYGKWPHFISTAPVKGYTHTHDLVQEREDIAIESGDLASLARARGLPEEHVLAAVTDHNATSTRPLTGSRWCLLGPAQASFTTTEGGLAIDQKFQVLTPEGQAIEGLYAVGQNGLGGQILWGHGLHIAWAITSGRLAGMALAKPESD